MEIDLRVLADAYLRNHRSQDRDEDFWAWEEVHRLVKADLDAAWEVTLLMLDKAESDDEVGYIAAGPLEDLIDIHGDMALDRIEEAAEKNRRLQLALSTVGVLFYYDEFDRWYGLLYRYGFREQPVAESREIVTCVVNFMKSYLSNNINHGEYDQRMYELLEMPLDDKRAQRIIQKASCDLEMFGISQLTIPERQKLSEPEFRTRVSHSLAELETLGYRPTE